MDRKTSKQKRAGRYGAGKYGTKRYAQYEIRDALRAHAKAIRARMFSTNEYDSSRWDRAHTHGAALGVMHALYRCGVITQAQFERADKRLERITKAKVTRRPFVPNKAARPAGPVVCSFGDELAGKAPPTFGPAAERRSA